MLSQCLYQTCLSSTGRPMKKQTKLVRKSFDCILPSLIGKVTKQTKEPCFILKKETVKRLFIRQLVALELGALRLASALRLLLFGFGILHFVKVSSIGLLFAKLFEIPRVDSFNKGINRAFHWRLEQELCFIIHKGTPFFCQTLTDEDTKLHNATRISKGPQFVKFLLWKVIQDLVAAQRACKRSLRTMLTIIIVIEIFFIVLFVI
mmetsp:Transcript_14808/g.35805  ORF Transcript_14808/g.35805 Transcript_14808/m.35805 type:complete len:206 (+) Transcript_14808:297-914(+)